MSQKIGSVSDLLTSMKMMSLHLWPANTDSLDELRLDVARRMLRSPHFNAKMNALKEVRPLPSWPNFHHRVLKLLLFVQNLGVFLFAPPPSGTFKIQKLIPNYVIAELMLRTKWL